MTTLEVLIEESVKKAMDSEAIRGRVEAAATKAIDEAIDRAFSYGSEFRKGVEAAVKEAIPITRAEHVQEFGFAVQQVIQRRLVNLANDHAEKHVGEMLDKLIGGERIIYMEDLEAAFRDKISSSHDCDCDDIEIMWDVEKGSLDGYWDLCVAEDEMESKYSSKTTRLRFNKAEDGVNSQCWMVRVGAQDQKISSIFAGPLYGFDAMVFRLATRICVLSTDRKPKG